MIKEFTTMHYPGRHFALLNELSRDGRFTPKYKLDEVPMQTTEFKTEWELVNYLKKQHHINLMNYNGVGYVIDNPMNTCRSIWTLN